MSAQTSRTLCRVVAEDGQSSVTVRLPKDNSRQLVFNDDLEGTESKVQCRGDIDAQCLAGSPVTNAKSVAECPECPCHRPDGRLFGPYSVVMAEEVDRRCGSRDQPARVLLLGLGAGELAAHVVDRCPEGLHLDAVELDGRLPDLARRYFGLADGVKVIVGDAFPVVQSFRAEVEGNALLADGRRYDVILVDCFASGGVTPEHCRSQEFLDSLRTLLRDGGKIMHHLWHEDPKHPEVASDFSATVDLYKKECASGQRCGIEVKPLDSKVDDLVIATAAAADGDSGDAA